MNRQPIAPQAARWDPAARHDMAIIRIERAVEKAAADDRVGFTLEDVEYVALLMGFDLREMRQSGIEWPHTSDTQSAVTDGQSSNRPSVRKPLDPNKTYRIRSTGERVTGAELLRRREQKA